MAGPLTEFARRSAVAECKTLSQLFATSRLHPAESVPGYILRIAELNHIPGAVFLAQLGKQLLSRPQSDLAIERAAALLNLPVAEWRRALRFPFGQELYERGELEANDNRFFNRSTCWICPKCFEDVRYHRSNWHLAIAPVCHFHKTYLVGACPACGKNLKAFRRRWLSRCDCKFELSNAPSSPLSDVDAELAALIEHRLSSSPTFVDHPLSNLPLRLLFRLIRVIGLASPAKSVRVRRAAIDYQSDFHRAAVALSNWPFSFHEAMDRLFSVTGDWEEVAFKSFATRLLGYSFPGEPGSIVRQETRLWLSNSAAFSPADFAPARTTKITHFSAMLLRDNSQILRRAKDLKIAHRDNGPGRQAWSVHAENLPRLAEDIEKRAVPKGYVRPTTANELLGVKAFTPLIELARDGFVRFRLHQNYVFFNEGDIFAILGELSEAARVPLPSDGLLQRVRYRSLHAGFPYSTLFNALAEGTPIFSVQPSQANFGNLLVRKDDHRRLSQAARLPRSLTPMIPRVLDVSESVSTLKALPWISAEMVHPPVIWHSRYFSQTHGSEF